jgi:hypothetical protein
MLGNTGNSKTKWTDSADKLNTPRAVIIYAVRHGGLGLILGGFTIYWSRDEAALDLGFPWTPLNLLCSSVPL